MLVTISGLMLKINFGAEIYIDDGLHMDTVGPVVTWGARTDGPSEIVFNATAPDDREDTDRNGVYDAGEDGTPADGQFTHTRHCIGNAGRPPAQPGVDRGSVWPINGTVSFSAIRLDTFFVLVVIVIG